VFSDDVVAEILLVEDDVDLAEAIASGLRSEYYRVTTVHDGATALDRIERQHFDLVLLDLLLPDMSGFAVCELALANQPALALVMITALGSMSSTVKGLEVGADDYLIKPFGVAELRARVHAVLRRRGEMSVMPEEETTTAPDAMVQSGAVTFQLGSAGIVSGGRRLDLRPREEELLRLLLRAPGVVLTRKSVEKHFQVRTQSVASTTIDWYVHELRRHLSEQIGVDLVETVYGLGWRVRTPLEGE
jgi:two-component system phosphate regulon response regulator PhoB